MSTINFNTMKRSIKLLTFFTLISIMLSCGSHPSKKMSQIIRDCPIGISEKEFNNKLSGQELVYSNTVYSTYKVKVSTFNYVHHTRSDYRFFYFKNGYLARIDKGERKVDYRIKVDN